MKMHKTLLVSAALVGLLFAATSASAQTTDIWTGTSGTDNNWDTGDNWSPTAEPGGTDIVQITDPSVLSTVNFQNPSPGTLTSVTIDGGMTLRQNQDTLSTGALNVGTAGTYTLAGSGTLQAGSVSVTGNGVVNLGSPGFVGTASGSLTSSSSAFGGGPICTSCTLNATTIDLGSDGTLPGTATVNQYGGTVNDDLIVGDATGGSYTNTNGTHNVTGNLILGNLSTGTGSYTITGGSAQTKVNFNPSSEAPNGALIVGNQGIGNFTQETFAGSDATPGVTVAGDLALGLQSGSTGTYTLNDGTLTIGGAVIVGSASTNANLFTQNGGTVNITGSAGSNSLYAPVSPGAVPPTNPGSLYIGGESVFDNGVGTYTMRGGTLSAGSISLGFSGVGTFNQSGNSQVTTGFIDMGDCGGCNGGNAAGFYKLNGNGTLTTGGINVGDFGHGEFVQGADLANNTVNTVNGTLAIGNGATATPNVANPFNYDRSGTYTLDSGTLNTQYTLVGNVGTGTLIQHGGTNNVAFSLDVGVQNTTLSGPVGSGTPSSPVFGGPALGTYTMNGGTLTIGGDDSVPQFASAYPTISGGTGMIIGDAGNGVFNQFDASTVTSGTPQVANVSAGIEGDLVIGAQGPATAGGTGTSQGTYNLGQTGQSAAPSLTINGSIIIGRDAGSNGATVPGASPTNANLVVQGDGTNLSVYYNGGGIPNANSLSSNILVGLSGNGAVTQMDKSTVYMDGDLSIGINQGAVGSYNLNATSNGGNLQVGNFLNIGGVGEFVNGVSEQTAATGGTGYFTQTSGDVTVVQDVNIGNNGGTGTYAMSGGTLAVGGYLNVGTNAGTGTFGLSNGAVTISGVTDLGNGGPGTSGTFTQTGGTFETGYLDVGRGGTVSNSFTLSNGTVTVDQDLVVGNLATGTGTNSFTQISGTVNVNSPGYGVYINNGTYDLQSGNFNVANNVTLGDVAGGASFTQEGGTASFGNNLIVGNSAGVTGSYTIGTGGTLNIGTNIANAAAGYYNTPQNSMVVGNSGTGTFTQTGGNVTIGGDATASSLNPAVQDLILGAATGSSGTYNMNGGNLTVYGNANINNSSIEVGFINLSGGGTGQFTQTGGTVNTYGFNGLAIGDNGSATGSGNYSISGGSLVINQNPTITTNGFDSNSTGNMFVGAHETGSMTQTGGSVSVAGDAFVGFANGASSSTWTINNSVGTSTVSVGGDMYVGGTTLFGGTTGTGEVDQSAGTATVAGTLDVGAGPGSIGLYTLSGGTLTTGITGGSSIGDVVIGNYGTGELDNSGGIQTSSSIDGFTLGSQAGSQGTYKLTGTGSLSVAGNENVGVFGTGVFQQSGTTSNTVGGSLYISSGFGGPSSSYTLTDGTLTVSGSEIVGFAAQGSFTQSGGSNSVTGGLTLGLLSSSPTQFGAGTYTLGGTGALNAGGDVVLGSGAGSSGTFNYNTVSGDAATLSFTGSGQNLVVGDAGTGFFNEGSATHTTNLNLQTRGTTLDIGRSLGGNGTFNLAPGSTLEDDMIVGDAGTGTFNNTGGTNTVGTTLVPANLILGNQATGVGTYNNNDGGNNIVNGNLTVGAAGTGTYNLGNATSGAFLEVQGSGLSGGNVVVGETGKGTITASSGSFATIAGVLTLGGPSPGETSGNGTLTVTGFATEWTNEGQTQIGGFGTGTLKVLAGGSFESHTGGSGSGTAAGLGFEVGSTGTATVDGTNSEWNMPDGALRVGVGSIGPGNGAQGNLLTISNGGEVIDSAGNGSDGVLVNPAGTDDGAAASVGWKSGSVGTVNVVTGGTWSNFGDLVIGDAGTGTVHLDNSSGSGIAVGGNLILGNLASGNGTLNLDNGGALNLNSGIQFIVGNAGTGVVNQNGGDLNLATRGVTIDIGAQDGSTGTYNLKGGSLEDDIIVGDAGKGTFNNTGATHSVTGNLILGNHSTGSGTYNLTAGGTTTVSGFTFVGAAGTGTFLNDASTHKTQDLVIGQQGTSSGNLYTLQNGGALDVGTVSIPGFMDVAEHGSGTFTQTSGTTTIIGDIDVGRCGGAGCLGVGDPDTGVGNGTVNLSGGSLSVSTFAAVGDSGIGHFNQSGGSTATIGTELDIGRNGGTGTYTIADTSSLTITTGPLVVGAFGPGGSGTLTQTGGTVTVSAGDTVVGDLSGVTGTYTLSGPGTLSISGELYVGAAGNGTFTQSGTGSSVTATALSIGNDQGGVGNYSLSAGLLTINGTTYLGGGVPSPSQGTITQTGGTANLNGDVNVGYATGGTGTYLLSDSAVANIAGNLNVGIAGTGTFNNAGGSNAVSGNLVLGNQASGNGTYNLSGATGSLTVSGSAEIGNAGIGAYAQSGGTATITGTMTINNNASSMASITGGTLGATGIINNSTLNLNGGTVNAPITNNATTQSNAGNTVTVNGAATNNAAWTVSAASTLNQNDGFTNNASGTFTVTGGSFATLGGGSLTNELGGTINVTGSSMTVNGATTNNGTVNVSSSTVFWNAPFTNNGAYHSDPSTSHFTDLNVGALGYLTGGTGDVFDVSGNFHNTSTQNTLWSTTGATLEFSGSTLHDMDLVGLDDGPNTIGYTNNYAWDLLNLDAGNSLSLDGTGPGTDALYVLALAGLDISGDAITNIFGNGLNIYYTPADDAALGGLTYTLENSGFLCPIGASTCTVSTSPPPPGVPEPGSLLLFGGGLAGLAFVRRRVARLKGQASAR